MKLNKHYGRCVICGKHTVLTYEHIPPRKALNDSATKVYDAFETMINGNNLPWDFEGRKYNILQKGLGKYTLCKECNNNTGSWFAKEYCDFANRMYVTLNSIAMPCDENVVVTCNNIYPLRIFKQIIAMFLSVNDSYELIDLQEFVKNKYSQQFDNRKYKVYMYINTGTMERLLPKSVIGKSGGPNNPIENMVATIVSEISTVPLGFILYFEPNEKTEYIGIDITPFSEMKYDDKCELQLPLIFKEVNSYFPIDFRTKKQIIQDRISNSIKNG